MMPVALSTGVNEDAPRAESSVTTALATSSGAIFGPRHDGYSVWLEKFTV